MLVSSVQRNRGYLNVERGWSETLFPFVIFQAFRERIILENSSLSLLLHRREMSRKLYVRFNYFSMLYKKKQRGKIQKSHYRFYNSKGNE